MGKSMNWRKLLGGECIQKGRKAHYDGWKDKLRASMNKSYTKKNIQMGTEPRMDEEDEGQAQSFDGQVPQ